MRLDQIPGYDERHSVRPGLTGLTQVYAPRDISRTSKFRLDRVYLKRASFWLDLKLILLSFWITGRGRMGEAQSPRLSCLHDSSQSAYNARVRMHEPVDVLIVGGGPGGLFMAARLAERGVRTLVCEEHGRVGDPVHCTGVLAADSFRRVRSARTPPRSIS